MLVLQTVGMPFSNAAFIWSEISIGLSTNLRLSVGTVLHRDHMLCYSAFSSFASLLPIIRMAL